MITKVSVFLKHFKNQSLFFFFLYWTYQTFNLIRILNDNFVFTPVKNYVWILVTGSLSLPIKILGKLFISVLIEQSKKVLPDVFHSKVTLHVSLCVSMFQRFSEWKMQSLSRKEKLNKKKSDHLLFWKDSCNI